MISVTTTSLMHLGVNHTFSSIQLSDQTDPLRAINLGAAASVPNLAPLITAGSPDRARATQLLSTRRALLPGSRSPAHLPAF